ncbi:hypothetical protein ACSLOE_30725, partial [Escherichia coli]
IPPAVRVCNADTASRHPDHFKPRLCERLNHILTAFYLSGMVNGADFQEGVILTTRTLCK